MACSWGCSRNRLSQTRRIWQERGILKLNLKRERVSSGGRALRAVFKTWEWFLAHSQGPRSYNCFKRDSDNNLNDPFPEPPVRAQPADILIPVLWDYKQNTQGIDLKSDFQSCEITQCCLLVCGNLQRSNRKLIITKEWWKERGDWGFETHFQQEDK